MGEALACNGSKGGALTQSGGGDSDIKSSADIARAFVCSFGCLKYLYANSNWFKYDNLSGWRMITEGDMQTILTRAIWEFKEDVSAELVKSVLFLVRAILDTGPGCDDSFDPSKFVQLDFARGDLGVFPATDWVACQNCLINVPAVALALYNYEPIPEESVRPLSSELFCPGRIPCNFDPDACCPRWLQFVSDSCSDDMETLCQAFGLSLTYDRRFNCFFVVYGEAGTGKSTALNILSRLNEGNTCSVPLNEFGERFSVYPLTTHRLNLVQDMDSVFEGGGSVSRREGVLKSLTAGERVQVERKYESAETRRLTALSVFGSNSLPRFADRSEAIADRLRIIQFPNKFRGTDKQDIRLDEKLNEELSGILKWSLLGYGALLATGVKTFPESRSAEILKKEAIKAARPEQLFCDDCLEIIPDVRSSTEEIYLAYNSYCLRYGYHPSGKSKVIPEICQYMGTDKPYRAKINGAQKKVITGVRLAKTGGVEADLPGSV